jgi:hypothetical protein
MCDNLGKNLRFALNARGSAKSMVIFNSRQVIFLHIHKTGGETIEHLLGRYRAWNDIMLDSENPGTSKEFERHFRLRKHSSARQVAKLIGMDVWDSYFTWATIRNPYARLTSLYSFVASMSEPGLAKIGFPINQSHSAQRNWVESDAYPSSSTPWSYGAVRAYLATRAARAPFSEFLRHPMLLSKEPAYHTQFSRLSSPRGDHLLVKRVVKLESLAKEWPDLCDRMKIPRTDLIVRNATPQKWKHSAKILLSNSDDVRLINTVYADDFRQFDYEVVGRDSVPRVIAAPSPSTL